MQQHCPRMPLADGCAAGLVHGVSGSMLSWIVRDSRGTLPRIVEALHEHTEEDVAMCQLTTAYELGTARAVNRRGLLQPLFNRRDAWAHPFKSIDGYMRCFMDREAGCLSPNGHLVLPPPRLPS